MKDQEMKGLELKQILYFCCKYLHLTSRIMHEVPSRVQRNYSYC